MKHLLAIILITFISVSCGGGGSSTDTLPDDDNPPGGIDDPVITGFDFTLKQGDFWEYEWDYYTSTVIPGGGSSGTKRGVFRITLGAPETVGELTAFPLIMSGNNRSGIDGVTPFITPRWSHIAINDNKVLLSKGGLDFKTVFDANTGKVIGFGFFEELSEDHLFEVSSGSIDNDYITEPAFVLSDSAGESDCEFFPSIGQTIGGAGVSVDFQMKRREYYQSNVGPVGYYYDFSSTSGDVSQIRTINIGLVASSTRGDVVDYALETEPNNLPAAASQVANATLPFTLKGDFSYQEDIDVSLPANYATNHYLYLNARNENEDNNTLATAEAIAKNESVHGQIKSDDPGEFRSFNTSGLSVNTSIEDWYTYNNPIFMPIDLELEFYDGAANGADIDLWIFNSSGNIVASNTTDDGSITMRPDLPEGDYYIGVDIWPGSGGAVMSANYTLSRTQTTFPGLGELSVSNQVAIQDFYRFTLNKKTGITITSTPSVAIFVTDTSGEIVHKSAPSTVDAVATKTVLVTPILDPGDYLIALGAQNYHYAEENFSSDTYQITIEAVPASAQ